LIGIVLSRETNEGFVSRHVLNNARSRALVRNMSRLIRTRLSRKRWPEASRFSGTLDADKNYCFHLLKHRSRKPPRILSTRPTNSCGKIVFGACIGRSLARYANAARSFTSAFVVVLAQCAQQKKRPPTSTPWPITLHLQCSQIGAIA
jgi:hypothetical protein